MKRYRILVRHEDADSLWEFADEKDIHIAWVGVKLDNPDWYTYTCTTTPETMTALGLSIRITVINELV